MSAPAVHPGHKSYLDAAITALSLTAADRARVAFLPKLQRMDDIVANMVGRTAAQQTALLAECGKIRDAYSVAYYTAEAILADAATRHSVTAIPPVAVA